MSKKLVNKKKLISLKNDYSSSLINYKPMQKEGTPTKSVFRRPSLSSSFSKKPIRALNNSDALKYDHSLQSQNPFVRGHRPSKSLLDGNKNPVFHHRSSSSGITDTDSIEKLFVTCQKAFTRLIESDSANSMLLSHIKNSYEDYIKYLINKIPSGDKSNVNH